MIHFIFLFLCCPKFGNIHARYGLLLYEQFGEKERGIKQLELALQEDTNLPFVKKKLEAWKWMRKTTISVHGEFLVDRLFQKKKCSFSPKKTSFRFQIANMCNSCDSCVPKLAILRIFSIGEIVFTVISRSES